MANVHIREGYKDAAWFTANPTLILKQGQRVNLLQTGTYKLGDGTTQLSSLSFLGGNGGGTKTEEIFNNVDGSTTKTLSQTPTFIFGVYNGSGQRLTNTVDYTISGATITFLYTFESTNIIVNFEY